ncbi:MAG: hypothetical protein J3Q66DRAFT_435334 [Benniella sp.]|nr:MAG: hypothetical protein J3Q66DRAFT_435334 [Benniella sp.]
MFSKERSRLGHIEGTEAIQDLTGGTGSSQMIWNCAVQQPKSHDPENSFDAKTCLPLPQCASFRENFDNSLSLIERTNFSGNPLDAPWMTEFSPNNARVENGNLILTLQLGKTLNSYGNRPGFAATVSSTSAMTGDEIDYEWVGKQPDEVQSNFYWHALPTMDPKDIDYNHALHHQVASTTKAPSPNTSAKNPSQEYHTIWDGGLAHPETQGWAGGTTDWSDTHPPYEMFVDWVEIKCYSPVDPGTTSWPPKNEGFQGFVNPLAQDPRSPLAKEAIVLGENAPTFSTREFGGLHWGRYNGGGKSLVWGGPKSEGGSSQYHRSWSTRVTTKLILFFATVANSYTH